MKYALGCGTERVISDNRQSGKQFGPAVNGSTVKVLRASKGGC